MKNLVIIGARGFGRGVYHLFLDCFKAGAVSNIQCKGFLDGDMTVLDGYKNYPPILSSVEDYNVQPDDVFVCAMGDPIYRKKYAEMILAQGGEFISLIYPGFVCGPNSTIGDAAIVLSGAKVGCDVTVGKFVVICENTVLGHDVKVGDWTHLGPCATLGGFCELGESVNMHPRVGILPHVKIGDNVVIGNGSTVLKDVPADVTVFGMPARVVSKH